MRRLIFWAGPLLGAFCSQILVAEACDVARLALGQLHVLFVYVSNAVESKVLGKTQPAAHFGENAPVVAGFPGGSVETGTKRNPAFGIRHYSGFFAPLRCRQQDVSVGRGFRGVGSF